MPGLPVHVVDVARGEPAFEATVRHRFGRADPSPQALPPITPSPRGAAIRHGR